MIPLITDLFTMHGHDGGHLCEHVHVSFVIYNNIMWDQDVNKKKININCHNKVQSKKSLGLCH